jgi:hypothetical protein
MNFRFSPDGDGGRLGGAERELSAQYGPLRTAAARQRYMNRVGPVHLTLIPCERGMVVLDVASLKEAVTTEPQDQ